MPDLTNVLGHSLLFFFYINKTLFIYSILLMIYLPIYPLLFYLFFYNSRLIYDSNITKISLLKDKFVNIISTINKFITTINFLNCCDLVNKIIYLRTEVVICNP
jgi:hypothetical protein